MDNRLEQILRVHKKGKISVENRYAVKNADDLALVYTPGVADVVKIIEKDLKKADEYTILQNTVGMFTDGTAVLGLGDVGPVASMPVMEGKAMIYREFAGINAYPLLLKSKEVKDIVATIQNLSQSFKLVHLEDIAAPNCFKILEELEKTLDIPVFHDDQYGTALIVLAGLINASKVLKKDLGLKIVINGAGAAGIAIARVLKYYGYKDIVLCDSRGIISQDRDDLNEYKRKILDNLAINRKSGDLKNALINTDVFVGVSVAKVLSAEMVKTMNKKPIIFALANPVPEILPSDLKEFDGIIATGRSDFPNQINNAVGYPGFIKGVLEAKIHRIELAHIVLAAKAIASTIPDKEITRNYIIPDVFNKAVIPRIVESLVG